MKKRCGVILEIATLRTTSSAPASVDCYIIDFYCPEAHLAIELDGGAHNYIAREMHDPARTKFLANQGIRVLRFWNHQVRDELDSVLESIWFELEERGRSNPSRLA